MPMEAEVMAVMRVCEILKADHANGPGMRVSVFVSGCLNRCPGCFNPETWKFSYGEVYDGIMEDRIIAELSKPHYEGITILGGEPFERPNQPEVLKLIRRIRSDFPDKTIWIYTGYTYEKDLVHGGKRHMWVTDEILESIDVLVDGRFMEKLKDLRLSFRGSANQRLIDMKKTRTEGKVCLWEE